MKTLTHKEKVNVLFDYISEMQSNSELIHINNLKLFAMLIENETSNAHFLYFENDTVIDMPILVNCPEYILDYFNGYILKNHYSVLHVGGLDKIV